MKFKLVDSYEFKWPIKVKWPSATRSGHFDVMQINASWKAMSKDRNAELQAAFESLTTTDEQERHQDDVIREVLVGWDEKDVLQADGKTPVPFSTEALEAALKLPNFRIAAYEAYYGAVSGGAVRGN